MQMLSVLTYILPGPSSVNPFLRPNQLAHIQLVDLRPENLDQINPVEPSKHRSRPFPSCDALKYATHTQ